MEAQAERNKNVLLSCWFQKPDADSLESFAIANGLTRSQALRVIVRMFRRAIESGAFDEATTHAIRKAASMSLGQ